MAPMHEKPAEIPEALSAPAPDMGSAFSPVCEPTGHTDQTKHHIDQEQPLFETALEAASNY
jgi:hypothetical protein